MNQRETVSRTTKPSYRWALTLTAAFFLASGFIALSALRPSQAPLAFLDSTRPAGVTRSIDQTLGPGPRSGTYRKTFSAWVTHGVRSPHADVGTMRFMSGNAHSVTSEVFEYHLPPNFEEFRRLIAPSLSDSEALNSLKRFDSGHVIATSREGKPIAVTWRLGQTRKTIEVVVASARRTTPMDQLSLFLQGGYFH